MGRQLNVKLTTTNLDDLFSAVPPNFRPPVALQGGEASFTGKVTGRLTSPNVSGHLTASRFSVAGRHFDSFDADASVFEARGCDPKRQPWAKQHAGTLLGTLGLRDWKALPSAPLAITGSIQNGDLADLLALAGQPSNDYSGQLSANVSVSGTLGNPRGGGSLVVTNGVVQGQPFDRAEAQVTLTDQLLTVPSAFVLLGGARVNVTGEFQHPPIASARANCAPTSRAIESIWRKSALCRSKGRTPPARSS